MKKRVIAAVLWFYAGWYAGAILADVTGIPPAVGLLIGAASALFVTADPLGRLWPQTAARPRSDGRARAGVVTES